MGSPKRYSARAEAVRCADEALGRMRAGETISAIHDDLTERREITMALRTFMQWMRRLENDCPYVPLSKPASSLAPREADADHTVSSRPVRHREKIGNDRRSKLEMRRRDPVAEPAREGIREPKKITLGTPIPPPLNTEPDNAALFGEDE